MYEAKIENTKGEILQLTQIEEKYQVMSILGLNPPNAQINQTSLANLDGAEFNSSKLLPRNIVITLKLNGAGLTVENTRQELYKFFPTKEWCKFYFKNENRNVYIEGYAETNEIDLFAMSQVMQISIICPQPYFKAIDETIDDISKIAENFKFPFSFGSKGATTLNVQDTNTDNAIPFSEISLNKVTNIYNDSETNTGVIIEINVLNNINNIEIRNTKTGEKLILDYDFEENDKIIINTNRGQKSIRLVRDAVIYNLFSAIQEGSKFLQLLTGDNFFSYLVDGGVGDSYINMTYKHSTVYRGV